MTTFIMGMFGMLMVALLTPYINDLYSRKREVEKASMDEVRKALDSFIKYISAYQSRLVQNITYTQPKDLEPVDAVDCRIHRERIRHSIEINRHILSKKKADELSKIEQYTCGVGRVIELMEDSTRKQLIQVEETNRYLVKVKNEALMLVKTL